MIFSAIASRSAVETPGATASRIASSAAATTRPAPRIFSICSGVFSWMSSWGRRMSAPVRPQGVYGAHGDVLDRAGRVDTHQLALRAEEVDQGRGLLGVLDQAVGDRLGLVVVTLEQLRPAAVADVLLAGRVELDVPDLAAATTGPAARQPPDDLVVGA